MQFPFGPNKDAEGVVLVDPATGQGYGLGAAGASAYYMEAVAQAVAADGIVLGPARETPDGAARVSVTGMSNKAGIVRLLGSFDGSTFLAVTEAELAPDMDAQITRPGLGHVAYRAQVENGPDAAVVNLSLTFTVA